MRHEPLRWHATGEILRAFLPWRGPEPIEIDWAVPLRTEPDEAFFVIAAELFQVYSQTEDRHIGEPQLAWSLSWGKDRYPLRPMTRTSFDHPLHGGHLFRLRSALRIAERYNYVRDQAYRPRLRRRFGLQERADDRFERWLNNTYPGPGPDTPASRTAEQWEEFVNAHAKRVLELEGREPIEVVRSY